MSLQQARRKAFHNDWLSGHIPGQLYVIVCGCCAFILFCVYILDIFLIVLCFKLQNIAVEQLKQIGMSQQRLFLH